MSSSEPSLQCRSPSQKRYIFRHCIPSSHFLYVLEKGNYRPVSVSPTISKFVERAIFDQLTNFFNFYFHPSLSAFRKGFGCQTALLQIIEDWKKTLDENKYIAAILMDLSKAFDCLLHDLILLKLEAYGLSEKYINLSNSYLSGRKQCVKVTKYGTHQDKCVNKIQHSRNNSKI